MLTSLARYLLLWDTINAYNTNTYMLYIYAMNPKKMWWWMHITWPQNISLSYTNHIIYQIVLVGLTGCVVFCNAMWRPHIRRHTPFARRACSPFPRAHSSLAMCVCGVASATRVLMTLSHSLTLTHTCIHFVYPKIIQSRPTHSMHTEHMYMGMRPQWDTFPLPLFHSHGQDMPNVARTKSTSTTRELPTVRFRFCCVHVSFSFHSVVFIHAVISVWLD